ncbi:hypothetical protein DFH27DRAFT_575950 [Peziza echinospora]|nr:hypothetical protein DFH27DRAFT_575950 [Peziza echinospora]
MAEITSYLADKLVLSENLSDIEVQQSDIDGEQSDGTQDELDEDIVVPGDEPRPSEKQESLLPPAPNESGARDENEEDEDIDGDGEFGSLALSNTQRKKRARREFKDWSEKKIKQIKSERKPIDRDTLDEDQLSAKLMISSTNKIINDPREYQLELFEVAKENNTIAVLDTGSGKTLIACLLLRHTVDKELDDRLSGKRRRASFFLVDAVTLVFQQAAVLECNLDCNIGRFCGAMGVDLWSKSQWEQVLERDMVLVMTADILYNNFTHGLLKMEDINLICFDEAHHAKKNHVYARIIRDFYVQAPIEVRPRIFGMTASPVDSRTDVLEAALDLERLLHSRISTASDLKLLQSSVTRPNEVIQGYAPLNKRSKPPLYSKLWEKFSKIGCFKRIFQFAYESSSELGTWCADEVWKIALSETEAIKIETRHERLSTRSKDDPSIAKVENELSNIREARNIVANHEFLEPTFCTPDVSSKVLKLCDVLQHTYDNNIDDKCIIFVTQRYTAYVLEALLQHANIPHLRIGVLIGARSGRPGEANVTFRQQMITVNRFRKGRLNCLIATSVAEEGLDIPDCSQIIRFDLYSTMIQYIQSRGRARHSSSKYVQMVDLHNVEHIHKIREVRSSEATMREFCQQLPADRHLKPPGVLITSELDEKYYIEPETGAKLTQSAALGLIWRYAGALPKVSGNSDRPHFYIRSTGKEEFICEIILPPEAPIKSIEGKACSTKAEAKQSAAFEACVALRQKGYLTEHLLPIPLEKKVPKGANQILSLEGAKSNTYQFKLKPSFWDVAERPPPQELYVTVFGLVDPEAMGRPYQPLCIITRDRIPAIPEFAVNADSGGRSNVYSVTLIEALPVDTEQLERLNEFTYRYFYDLFNKTFERTPDIPYWLFPVKNIPIDAASKPLDIFDNETIDLVMQQAEYKWDENTPEEFFKNKLLLHRSSRSRRFFTERVAPEFTPNSLVPPGACTAPGTPTIWDYSHFSKAKGSDFQRRNHDQKQPVLRAKRVLHRINYLDTPTEREINTHLLAYIVPSAFEISCLPPSFASIGLVFPSIITRLDGYLHAKEVCEIVGVDLPLATALEAITKDSENTENSEEEQIQKRGMTSNYERLEFLGDTFLKLSTTLSLFVCYDDADEYQLHVKRMKMLCNLNLFNTARSLKLPQYIQTQGFSRREWYPKMNLLQGRRSKSRKKSEQAAVQEGTDLKERKHYHKLAPKTIADVCEALIGAAIQEKGFDEAVKVVNTVVNSPDHDREKIKTWSSFRELYKPFPWTREAPSGRHLKLADDIEKTIGYRFNSPRLLASAFLHPSMPFSWEGIPNYQRLEFLGDALHDQACIRYVFDLFPDKGPQWLTEHKMAMVSNKFLAALAVKLDFHRHIRKNGAGMSRLLLEFTEDLVNTEAKYDGDVSFWTHLSEPIPKFLGDCLEAFIGAIFLDAGLNFKIVEDFFDRFIKPYFADMSIYDTYAGNHPTTLLTTKMKEVGCEDWRLLADYGDSDYNNRDASDAISPTNYTILAAVMVHDKVFAHGHATNVKQARMKAAQAALLRLEDIGQQGLLKFCNCATAREKLRQLRNARKEAEKALLQDGKEGEMTSELMQLQIELVGKLSVIEPN